MSASSFAIYFDVPEDQKPCAFLGACTKCRLKVCGSHVLQPTRLKKIVVKLDICKATSGPHEAERYHGKFRMLKHLRRCVMRYCSKISLHWYTQDLGLFKATDCSCRVYKDSVQNGKSWDRAGRVENDELFIRY